MRPVALVDSAAELGGAQLSLLPVARSVVAAGAPAHAFLPAHGPLEDELAAAGVLLGDGFLLDAVTRGASGSYGGASLALARAGIDQQVRFARSLRALRPAAVYLNGARAQVGGTLPARAAGARVVWHVRDFARPGLVGAAWRGLAQAADLVIANSRAVAAQPALRTVRRRVVVIHNGIDLERFAPRAAEPEGPPVVGMAAHLTPWKGHERFLRIVRALADRFSGLRARIAGRAIYDTGDHAEYPARIRAQIAALGLDDVVTIDAVSPAEMPAWLAGLTALVHCPDRPEPFGRVLAEGLAVGVPVVVAAAGGAPEAVGDAGLHVAPLDEPGVVDATARLLDDAGLRARLADAGVERAQRLFDERRYARSVAEALLAGR